MKTSAKETAESAYIAAYDRAMQALKDIESMIHDNPAPGGDIRITWGNVGDMARIAHELESILPED